MPVCGHQGDPCRGSGSEAAGLLAWHAQCFGDQAVLGLPGVRKEFNVTKTVLGFSAIVVLTAVLAQAIAGDYLQWLFVAMFFVALPRIIRASR